MTDASTGITLGFAPTAPGDEYVFQMVMDDNGGKKPVHIKPIFVLNWSWSNGRGGKWEASDLVFVKSGIRRIRLYCSDVSSLDVTMYVNGGSAEYIGERQAEIRESFSWNSSQDNRLAYWHSAGDAVIVHTTKFFDADGAEISRPILNTQTGEIHHDEKVTGSLIVEYNPTFLLYEITYDSGVTNEAVNDVQVRKMEMLTAWLAGKVICVDAVPARHNSNVNCIDLCFKA